MPQLPQSGIELVAEGSNYARNINEYIALGAEFDDVNASIVSGVNELSSAFDDMTDVDVSLNVEVEDGDFTTLEEGLDSFDGSSYEGEAIATTSGEDEVSLLDADLMGIDGTTAEGEAVATTSGEEEVSDLESGMEAVEGEHEGSVEVDANQTDNATRTFSMLDAIKSGLVFTAIINVAGTILDALRSIENLTITPFLDVDEASAAFAAHTGEAAESVDDMIFRLHQADLGDFNDIEAVLETGRSIGLIGDELEDATAQALTFTKVFDDQNPTDVIAEMNRMIELGLVDNFQEAADVLTVAFQQGGNRAGDLLQTLEMYGPMFSAMGLDANEAMALLNEGLRNGYRNTADFARQIATMQDNVIAAQQDAGSAAAEAFDDIGVDLPAEGEEMGAEFIQNVINGINSLPPGAGRDAAISAIFGRRAGGTEAILDVDIGASFENIEGGEADRAASVLDDHIRGTIDDLGLELETLAQHFLSSEQIDLPGKIAAIKEGLQTALEDVGAGMSLGEALEHGLQIPGLADFIQNIEGALGNFEIVLLQVIASLADLVGQSDVAASAREEVTRLGEQQLAFDIKIADDGDAITAAVSRAVDRGVDQADIQTALSTAVTELIDEGDIQAAQELIDTIEIAPDFIVDQDAADRFVGESSIALELDPVSISEMPQEEIDRLVGAGVLIPASIDTTDLQAQVDAAQEIVQSELDRVSRMPQELAYHAGESSHAPVQFPAPPPIAPTVQADMDAVTTAVETTANSLVLSTDQIASSIEGADDRIHEAVISGSIVPDIRSIARAAIESFPQVVGPAMVMASSVMSASMIVGSGLTMIRSIAGVAMPAAATYVNILTNAIEGLGNTAPVLDSIIEKLRQVASVGTDAHAVLDSVAAAGGSITNVSNTSVTVNQTNNVQSQAEAASLGFANSRAIRGFS